MKTEKAENILQILQIRKFSQTGDAKKIHKREAQEDECDAHSPEKDV